MKRLQIIRTLLIVLAFLLFGVAANVLVAWWLVSRTPVSRLLPAQPAWAAAVPSDWPPCEEAKVFPGFGVTMWVSGGYRNKGKPEQVMYLQCLIAAGLPFRAVDMEMRETQDGVVRTAQAVDRDRRPWSAWSLPVHPRWTGFLGNSLSYAWAAWALPTLVGSVVIWRRRRNRRQGGRCINCGYDLRDRGAAAGSPCPECGSAAGQSGNAPASQA